MDVVVVLDDLGAVGDEVVVVAFGVSVSTVVVVLRAQLLRLRVLG